MPDAFHSSTIRPQDFAVYDAKKMSKATLFRSERILVGLNCFEPGQEHKLHAHAGMDKVYHVLEGSGLFLLEGRELRGQTCWHGESVPLFRRPRRPLKRRRAGGAARTRSRR